MESEIDVGQTFKNAYEASKNRSEVMISEAHRSGAVRASITGPASSSVIRGPDARLTFMAHTHSFAACGLHCRDCEDGCRRKRFICRFALSGPWKRR